MEITSFIRKATEQDRNVT